LRSSSGCDRCAPRCGCQSNVPPRLPFGGTVATGRPMSRKNRPNRMVVASSNDTDAPDTFRQTFRPMRARFQNPSFGNICKQEVSVTKGRSWIENVSTLGAGAIADSYGCRRFDVGQQIFSPSHSNRLTRAVRRPVTLLASRRECRRRCQLLRRSRREAWQLSSLPQEGRGGGGPDSIQTIPNRSQGDIGTIRTGARLAPLERPSVHPPRGGLHA
jgi:hypothetical protein